MDQKNTNPDAVTLFQQESSTARPAIGHLFCFVTAVPIFSSALIFLQTFSFENRAAFSSSRSILPSAAINGEKKI